jgi:hypothetical protein
LDTSGLFSGAIRRMESYGIPLFQKPLSLLSPEGMGRGNQAVQPMRIRNQHEKAGIQGREVKYDLLMGIIGVGELSQLSENTFVEVASA